MDDRIYPLADKAEILDVIYRYFAAVDDKQITREVVASTYTADGAVIRPNGAGLVGHDAIFNGQSTSFARFRGTHHTISNPLVDLAGDTARVRANITAMHLWAPNEGDPFALEPYFLAGGVLTGQAVRTPGGWRVKELMNRIVWRTGSGFGAVLNTGKASG
jgi:ketosteroid isomerase-like protein